MAARPAAGGRRPVSCRAMVYSSNPFLLQVTQQWWLSIVTSQTLSTKQTAQQTHARGDTTHEHASSAQHSTDDAVANVARQTALG